MNDLDTLSVRDLRSVVVLADRLHFGRAAEDLGVAQPSLSSAIKKVEGLCGELLFERTSRQVALTPAGQRVVQRARAILEEVERLGRGVERSGSLAGRFRLGLLPTIGPYYAPEFLGALRLEYPRLELVLTEAVTEALIQMLRQRQLDAALICLPSGERGLTETPLVREPFDLAVSAGHPLAESGEVGLWQLEPRQMILMERGHCLRDQALEACGATPDTATGPMQAASLETLRHLVAAGNGCAVLPRMAVRAGSDCRGLVTYVPFRDPAPSRTVGLVFDDRCTRIDDATELGRFLKRLAGAASAG
jgi:LysR family hydrogen peroxide-inducible transcriptional activator